MPFGVAKSKKLAEESARASAKINKTSGAAQNTTAEGMVELALVIKADVQGSADAIVHELGKLSHERVQVNIISTGVGAVSETDVRAAAAGNAVIIGFNVGTDAQARDLAMRDHVQIEPFTIIYELSQKVVDLLKERSPILKQEEELGKALVLKTFSSGAKKQVLGLRYQSGILTLGALIKILRKPARPSDSGRSGGDEELARGKFTNLQVARADVKEIKSEGDFGAEIEAKVDATYGDIIVSYRVSES
jgi:translation initiation factor IF-2